MSVPTANTYAVMSFGGFLGLGKSCHPLPWHVLTYDPGRGGDLVELDKARLRAALNFSEGENPDWGDRAWAGGIDAYYADRPTGHATRQPSIARSTTAFRPATRSPVRAARPARTPPRP